MPDTPPLRLAEFLPYRFSIVAERMSRLFAQRYERAFGLTIAEWRVMAVLGEQAPLATQRVIEATEMDRVKVSRAVTRLADKGLISRQAPREDRRAQRLDLTLQGRAMYEQIIPLAHHLQAQLAHQLDPAERDALERILDKLHAAATP